MFFVFPIADESRKISLPFINYKLDLILGVVNLTKRNLNIRNNICFPMESLTCNFTPLVTVETLLGS